MGMSRWMIAIVVLGILGSSARAERICVTASDQSESGLADLDRKANADTVKRVLDLWVADQNLEADRQIDVGVVKLTVDPAEDQTSVLVELRFAVSDDHGQMVSVLSSTSKVTLPGRTTRARSLPKLRREAIVAATQAALPKLRQHLHAAPPRTQTRELVQRLATWFSRISPRPVS